MAYKKVEYTVTRYPELADAMYKLVLANRAYARALAKHYEASKKDTSVKQWRGLENQLLITRQKLMECEMAVEAMLARTVVDGKIYLSLAK